jgi:hypothetical protein
MKTTVATLALITIGITACRGGPATSTSLARASVAAVTIARETPAIAAPTRDEASPRPLAEPAIAVLAPVVIRESRPAPPAPIHVEPRPCKCLRLPLPQLDELE